MYICPHMKLISGKWTCKPKEENGKHQYEASLNPDNTKKTIANIIGPICPEDVRRDDHAIPICYVTN